MSLVPNLAELYLTDGETYINLLSKMNGFAVQDWQPVAPEPKDGGVWQDSKLSEGRRLVSRQLNNTIESFTLAGRGGTADLLIQESQRIRRMLEKSISYWTSEWQNTPVYLIARGVNESNTRFGHIYDYRAPGDSNPFASPFTGPDAAIFAEWSLIIEHDAWTDTPPGESTAVQVSGMGTFNGVTYGRAATTTNEVYVANKQNKANITHIFRFDDSAGTFSSNLFGAALPYNLFPSPLGAGDILYVISDTSVTDSGPFASVVWDIGVAMSGLTIVVEIYTGSWITLLTIVDNTNTFQNTGVNSIHWQQPATWVTVAINGVTGYAYRYRVTAALGTIPTQQNRQPYSITWPYVDIDDLQVGGDIPALLLAKIQNQGNVPQAVDRVLVGLRSSSRGSLFNAYLNLSDEQNQTGVTVAVSTLTTFVARAEAPSGRAARYNPAVEAISLRVSVTLNNTLTTSYKGRYRVFMRAIQVAGSAGDIFVRLRAALFSTTTTAYYTSQTLYTQLIGEVELFDFGQFQFPPPSQQEGTLYSGLSLLIDAGSISTTPDLYMYDLILLPIDEWAGDYLNPNADASTALGPFIENRRLEIDAISYPRVLYSSVLKQINDDAVVTNWQPITTSHPILQANADQQLWFLMADFSGGAWQSHIENAYSLQVFRKNRYLSMRGAR